MGMLAKIRRMRLREHLSIREIARRTGLSRNTVRDWLRQPQVVEPRYAKREITTKLDAYAETLSSWLTTNRHRGKRERRRIEHTEGAKFWLKVFTDLKQRGLADILIAVVDGLRGFPEAIEAVYPQTQIQTCIVHLIRNSLNHVGWKERKALAAQLKSIYQAPNADAAEAALRAFEQSPQGKHWPPIAQAWRRQWVHVIPFFAYPQEVRKIIYTTNAIESLHMRLRKIVKTRGHFPSDEAATKLPFLALRNIAKNWTMPPRTWRQAANQFAIVFGDRFTNPTC